MAPRVRRLECQTIAEAAVEPQLHRVVAGVAVRLGGTYIADALQRTVVLDNPSGAIPNWVVRNRMERELRDLSPRVPKTGNAPRPTTRLVRRNVVAVYV